MLKVFKLNNNEIKKLQPQKLLDLKLLLMHKLQQQRQKLLDLKLLLMHKLLLKLLLPRNKQK
jgi:hypothetical protein